MHCISYLTRPYASIPLQIIERVEIYELEGADAFKNKRNF